MKKKIIVFTLSALCVFLFCIQVKKNNPLLPDFQGDYRLSIQRTSLPDSMMVFHEYALVCSTGADTFSTYQLTGTARYAIVIDRISFGSLDSLFVHCVAPFSGFVTAEGVRPNGKTVSDSVHARVVNPYRILGDSVAVVNEMSLFRLARPVSDTDASDAPVAGLSVIWSSGVVRDSTGIDSVFFFTPPASQPRCTVSAMIKDASVPSHSLALDPAAVRVITSARPVLSLATVNGPLLLGKPMTLTILLSNADTSLYRIFVESGQWRDTTSPMPLKTRDTINFSRSVTDTGLTSYSIFLFNSSGLRSNTIVLQDTIRYSLPVISFTAESLLVSLGDTFPVTVSSAPAAAKYVWILDLIKADTTTAPNYRVLVTDSLYHTLMVHGIDQYGYAGKIASVVVYARPFEYVIQPVSFPVDCKAKTWTQWIAAVNNQARATQKDARYAWTITPQNYDSLRYGGAANDSLWLYWKDSAHAIVTVSVSDTAYGGTSAPYAKSVSVRRYAPFLAFKQHTISVKTTDDIILSVSAADSNSATGGVDSIFWRRGGKGGTSYVSKDSIWVVHSPVPDTFWVSAYCRDNDGFLSMKDSVQVFVKAFRPYFQPLMSDTTVFINSPIVFKAQAHVSDTTAVLAKYYWDFDANGTWDDSTTVSSVTHSFPNAGVMHVVVKCRDSKGVESSPDTFRVTVSTGGPVISGFTPDSCWIKDSVTYSISAYEVNPNGSIASYGVAWDGGTVFMPYTTPSAKFAFSTDGIKHVRIFSVDNNGISSDTAADSVFVRADIPIADSIRADSVVFVADSRIYTVFGNGPHSAIDSFKIFFGASSAVSSSGAFAHVFQVSESGSQPLKALVKNHAGFWSDTLRQNMVVRLGKPKVVSIVSDTPLTRVFINDPITFTISGSDTNGSVDSIKVDTGTGTFGPWLKATAGQISFARTFPRLESGSRTLRAIVKDNDGIQSDTSNLNVTVRLGRPKMVSITKDSAIVYVHDPVNYTITANDTNGTIREWYLAKDSINGFSQIINGRVQTAFLSPGLRTYRAYVVDNDSLVSDTLFWQFMVHAGAPVVDSLYPKSIYANDDTTFSIYSRDTNGTVDSLFIDWGDATPVAKFKTGDLIHHKYATAKAGIDSVKITAKDNDGVVSDVFKYPLIVHSAVPVVDSVKIDTTGNNIFVKDLRTYRVYAHDTNGTIKTIYAAWNNGTTPDDSVQVVIPGGGYGSLTHRYDTTLTGNRTARFWVRDDDTIMSSSKDTTVLVRLAPPVLWGDAPAATGDTTWVIINNGAGRPYPVHINHFDTNGTIVNYYWNEAGATLGRMTATDTIMRSFSQAEMQYPLPIWIYGRDNDSLTRGGKFIMFADSVPPAPVINAVTAVDSITIYFKNKDAKDGNLTQYRVLMHDGSEPDSTRPADILSDWKSGYRIADNSPTFDFMIKFKLTANTPQHLYYYQVHARDARGSVSPSTNGHIFSY